MHIDTIQCLYHFKQVLKHCDSPLWELERHLHVVLPIGNDTEAVLPKLKVQTRAIRATLGNALDYQIVQSAVRRHQDRQRYARQSARALAFFNHLNGETDLASLEMSLKSYFQRQKWTTQNDGNQDLRKVLLVLPMFITPKVETNIAIQKIYYKGLASNIEFEDQTLHMERCRSQKWPGVTQVFLASLEEESLPPEFSRKMKSSLITTGRFSSRHQWKKYPPLKVLNGSFVWKSKDLAEG